MSRVRNSCLALSMGFLVACSGASSTPDGTGGASQSASGGATQSASGGATQSASGGATQSGTGGAASGSGGAVGSGGASSGGATGSGGSVTAGQGGGAGSTKGTGGAIGSGGSGTAGTGAGGKGGATTSGTGGANTAGLAKFSFFVTSVGAMKRLSKSDKGFGGDLRYGEATGLAGADKICTEIAETSMKGAGAKGWKAFLSTTKGGTNDGPVNAIDRLGDGPWYDRLGRILAMNKAALMNTRPQGADPAIIDDFPNEDGVPNHSDGAPGCTGNNCPDNHDFLTGTDTKGKLYSTNWSSTCHDWTSVVGTDGKPRCGHSWPRGTQSWMSVLDEAGCAPSIELVEAGGPKPSDPSVGSGGGYGGIYCFASMP